MNVGKVILNVRLGRSSILLSLPWPMYTLKGIFTCAIAVSTTLLIVHTTLFKYFKCISCNIYVVLYVCFGPSFLSNLECTVLPMLQRELLKTQSSSDTRASAVMAVSKLYDKAVPLVSLTLLLFLFLFYIICFLF